MGLRHNGWFTMETRIQLDDDWGYPNFKKPPYIYTYIHSYIYAGSNSIINDSILCPWNAHKSIYKVCHEWIDLVFDHCKLASWIYISYIYISYSKTVDLWKGIWTSKTIYHNVHMYHIHIYFSLKNCKSRTYSMRDPHQKKMFRYSCWLAGKSPHQ